MTKMSKASRGGIDVRLGATVARLLRGPGARPHYCHAKAAPHDPGVFTESTACSLVTDDARRLLCWAGWSRYAAEA
jgi:hypothetical protein